MKSEAKIVPINYNTHVTYEYFFFEFCHYPWKQRGGRSPSAKKTHFFGPTEISGRLCGRRSQNLAGWKKIVSLAGVFKDFLFESKTKKLCHFKVSQFEIFEKQGCPPLWNGVPPPTVTTTLRGGVPPPPRNDYGDFFWSCFIQCYVGGYPPSPKGYVVVTVGGGYPPPKGYVVYAWSLREHIYIT